jgi:hypothetical protein
MAALNRNACSSVTGTFPAPSALIIGKNPTDLSGAYLFNEENIMKKRNFFVAAFALTAVCVATQAQAKRELIRPSTDCRESFGLEQFVSSAVKGATLEPTRPAACGTTQRRDVEPEKLAGPGVP